MSTKISFVSGKGGVGKSSICFSFAKALNSREKKVLIIDLDIGLHTQDILLNVADKVLYNWNDVLCQRCDVNAAIIKGKIDLIAAPEEMECSENNLFSEMIEKLDDDYDYILFDCPAGIFGGFELGVKNSDLILAITTQDKLCSMKVNTVSNKIRKLCDDINIRLIINKYVKPSFFEKDFLNLDEIINLTEIQLAGVIPSDIEFAENILKNKEIEFCEAYQAVQRIIRRLEGKTVPLSI
ncbi:MAG: AAA family ATPase [Clostridia bacterium]|nr:AAA family ATPase [Clostridia bacterium]